MSSSSSSFVWVKDASSIFNVSYVKVILTDGIADVSDLKKVVRAEFLWQGRREDAINLFLVSCAGKDDEPDVAEEINALDAAPLKATRSLVAANVKSGCFLLVKFVAGEPLAIFERLLIRSGLPSDHLDAPVAQRARIKYSHLVMLAIMEDSHKLARDAYEMAKRLPSTTTVEDLYVEGFKMNGMLYEGSKLVICYRGERVQLLKGLREDEAVRARIFHDALAGEHVPHVTPYELIETAKGKNYMIMPKFATTLEPLPFLSSDGVAMLWAHVQEALEGLHARGFAHADVKPAKICLTEDGGSVFLIDLGSMARMGERTSSTASYVPLDVPRGRASAALDWWMLAMTLAEKACGSGQGLEVGGTSHATMNELRTHLASHLSPAVWAALEPKLVE